MRWTVILLLLWTEISDGVDVTGRAHNGTLQFQGYHKGCHREIEGVCNWLHIQTT